MKTKLTIKNVIAALLLLASMPLLSMCDKPVENNIEIPDLDTSYLILNSSANAQVFSTDESFVVNFITNKDWSISVVDGDWVSAPDAVGAMGSFEYVLNVSPNTSDESREATIELVAGNKSETISIFQYAAGMDPILQNLTIPVSLESITATGWWVGSAISITDYVINDEGDTIISEIARAFLVDESEVPDLILGRASSPSEGMIAVGLMSSNGTLSYTSTAGNAANGPCFYCTGEGDPSSYGAADVRIYFEYKASTTEVQFNSYPNKTVSGDVYNIRPVFTYTKSGKQFTVTLDTEVVIQ
ncbi:MAG: DUF4859 domain-containing protein [Rikenellaceae bacterium]